MTDTHAQGLGLLAKLVIAAAATLVIAGIVWHGIALDNFQRMWSDLIDRPSGPMAFRIHSAAFDGSNHCHPRWFA